MNKRLEELLVKLKHERVTQKTYCTDTPIYLVQTRYDIVVNEDFEAPRYYKLYIEEFAIRGCYLTLSDILYEDALNGLDLDDSVINQIKEQYDIHDVADILNENNVKAEALPCHDGWKTAAYFLTLEDAENYMHYQSHNLGECRLYVDTVGYDNRGLLAQILRMLDKKDEEL